MKHGKTVGLLLVAISCVVALLAVTAAIDVVSGVVLGVLALVLSVPAFIVGGLGAAQERDATFARELPSRGRRRRGVVRDAAPYASVHGGAVFQRGGAQMVLSVEAVDDGGKELVSLHVVEPSDAAKARVGTEVTFLEHPEAPTLRALEGFAPNGIRL